VLFSTISYHIDSRLLTFPNDLINTQKHIMS